jgi:eukaryotic-like serine/threonine-protein kinase
MAVGAGHGAGEGAEPVAVDWASTEHDGRPDRELRPHRVLEGAAEWSDGFERDERAARSHRLRLMLVWGGLAYLTFLPTDLMFNAMRGEPYGPVFMVARLIGLIPLVVLWFRLGRGPTPSQRTLMAYEALATSSVAAVIGFQAVLSGAIGSPILAGLVPVLVARGVGIPDPWRRALLITAAPALVFWMVVLVGGAVAPELVDSGPDAIGALLMHLGIHAVTLGLVVIGSHISWDMRRNLYKARRVGRYELLRPLGRGAMGEVWAAWHQGLRQEVALKLLPIETGDGPGRAAIARFEREVVATTKLRHPNTVRVYDFGLTPEGFWYYAMELLEGETVAELVAREGPLEIPRALELVRQAARALREAHQRGVVHRDIKPENLFVSAPAGERDFVKVLDFGVASVAAEALQLDQGPTEPLSLRRSSEDGSGERARIEASTEPGFGQEPEVVGRERAVGTPLTISPEAARGRPTDARSDIYGLGCVLYFMLTARPVFIERDSSSLLRAHVGRKPTPPSALLSNPLPDYVEKLVLRCLAKDPDERYVDADALVRAIDLCLRLGDNDRRRGESQRPRVRASREQVEQWAEQSRTDTDMSLIKE